MRFPEEFREEPAGPAEFGAGFGARGVSGLCVLRAEVAVPGSPLPGSLGHSGAQPPGRAGRQQILAGSPAVCFCWCPELSPPHVFGSPWQSLGRSVVGRGILHVPVSDPLFLRPSALPPLQRARVWLWCGAPSSALV